MTTDLFSWFSSSDPVPTVAPADLRSVWAMQRRAGDPSGQPTAASIRLFEHVCSPGADVQAVVYRVWMLWAATFPMKRMSLGVSQQELPFDVQGFLAEIGKQ